MNNHDEMARRLEQERRELKNAPVVKIVTDAILRCHFCGAVTQQLYEIETLGPNLDEGEKGPVRLGCEDCHPEARKVKWEIEAESRPENKNEAAGMASVHRRDRK